jgi:8-oxo-dGTP pyrophosphatase MutT (NUDIX family)
MKGAERSRRVPLSLRWAVKTMATPLEYSWVRERLVARREGDTLGATVESRQAAVAAVLRPADDDVEVLLIRRAEHPLDSWSGHMAFPGGRKDPGDATLLDTALRETLEEVGLDLRAEGELWSRLPAIQAVAGGQRIDLTITPFVFGLPTPATPLVANYEVAEIVWGSLGSLLRREANTTVPFSKYDQTYVLPEFDVEGRIVWGLTHRMLSGLLALLRD